MRNPIELVNRLILFIGNTAPEFKQPVSLRDFQEKEHISLRESAALRDFLVEEGLAGAGSLELEDQGRTVTSLNQPYLTYRGWERYYQLISGHVTSRIAFMAMQFGNDRNGNDDYIVEKAYNECFTKAVAGTGYELRKVTDNQPAGTIDEHIIVGIRTARFLIVDLTDGNRGAYWEAGFAEGLGKPVIYTCNEEDWKNRHFDIEHKNTIRWQENDWEEAIQKLKNIIRATFPEEAKMEDF